jgi:hypothetical protein
MAKSEKDDPVTGPVPAAEPTPAQPATFRDKEYRSRMLVLPDWRVLLVEQFKVTVEGDDTTAIAFLRKRSDFEQVRE